MSRVRWFVGLVGAIALCGMPREAIAGETSFGLYMPGEVVVGGRSSRVYCEYDKKVLWLFGGSLHYRVALNPQWDGKIDRMQWQIKNLTSGEVEKTGVGYDHKIRGINHQLKFKTKPKEVQAFGKVFTREGLGLPAELIPGQPERLDTNYKPGIVKVECS